MNDIIDTKLNNINPILLLEAAGTGLLAGFMVSCFRLLISFLENLRNNLIDTTILTVLFFIFSYLLICLCLTLEKNIPGSGIPHVKGELNQEIETIWWRVLVTKIIGVSCAIGAGLSVGKEGPAVQIGAMSGKGISRLFHRPLSEEKILLTSGAGAGLAAAFNAPLAGSVFAIEEINKKVSLEVVICSLTAATTSNLISSYVFRLTPVFTIEPDNPVPLEYYWLILLFGIALGLSGWVYNMCLTYIQKAYDFIPWMPVRIAIPVGIGLYLAYEYPSQLGSGNTLINILTNDNLLLATLFMILVIKFIYSMLSFGSGTPGGIFFTLLILGAIQGCIFSCAFLDGEFVQSFIMLGMAGFFTASARRPVTGAVLIIEIAKCASHIPCFAIICFASYMTSKLLKTKPVYDQLLERILSKEGKIQ